MPVTVLPRAGTCGPRAGNRQEPTVPGVAEIMLDLLYDIRRNGPTFKAMQQFLRDRRPPALLAAGVNDEIIPGEVQRQIHTGLPLAPGLAGTGS